MAFNPAEKKQHCGEIADSDQRDVPVDECEPGPKDELIQASMPPSGIVRLDRKLTA